MRGKTRTNGQGKKKKQKPNSIDKHNLILWFNAAKQKFCYSSLEDSQRVIYRNPAQKAQPLPISWGWPRAKGLNGSEKSPVGRSWHSPAPSAPVGQLLVPPRGELPCPSTLCCWAAPAVARGDRGHRGSRTNTGTQVPPSP